MVWQPEYESKEYQSTVFFNNLTIFSIYVPNLSIFF